MNAIDVKANCLYEYPPFRGKWGKHGLVRTFQKENGIYAQDTYWIGSRRNMDVSDFSGTFKVTDKEAANMEFLTEVSGLKEVRGYDEWVQYKESERFHIPIGGGHEEWLVLKTAQKDPKLQRKQINYEISQEKDRIRSAQGRLKGLREKLAEICH